MKMRTHGPLKNYLLLIAAFFLIVCFSHNGFSHPHVFVDGEVTVVFDDKGLAGFRQRWIFDEMFSNTIISSYDKDKNHILDIDEIGKIKKGAFNNLSHYGYFSHVLIDGKKFDVKYVAEFLAAVHNNRLIYTFFVPCHVSAVAQYKNIIFALFDKEYYTDLTLAHDAVSFEGNSHFVVKHEIKRIEKFSFYYGQIIPEGVSIKFKTKNE
jgi:ABC-type uncharacterized transport system substrate-binding protein